jgi:hypothetical protein
MRLSSGTRLRGTIMALAASLTATLPATGHAQPGAPPPLQVSTVADLSALCGAAPDAANYASAIAFCHGFLQGTGQYHAAVTQPGSGIRPVFCAPSPPPTLLQISSAFAAWAAANPRYASERAADGLVRWASETYPCPQPAARPRRP